MKLDWTEGNRITLLENGEGYYPRVFEAIAGARREVLLETFIWFDDTVGRRLREVLLQAAANGARVHVLVDGWGSPDLDEAFLAPLVAGGVVVRAFEPVKRFLGARVNLLRRMHRKIVVVDGERAFVGGINYSIDHLIEYGPEAKQDYAVEIDGPLVAQIHAFCRACLQDTPQPPRETWIQRWRRMRAALQRRAPAPSSTATAAFVTRDNDRHRNDIERAYRTALRLARRRVVIANAYFFPGWRLLKEMRRCARRGVQVDLILQGQPDMAIVQTAASLLHAHLVRAGIRVHEYCERPLHGKVAVVDDEWATVGSSNLDPTSLGLNLEANVVVRDRAFATHLRERLDTLLRDSCREVVLPKPGWLGSAWIGLRSAVVFHLLRSFPNWVMRLPAQAPKVALLGPGPR
jgi:cardiolipin synthase